MSMTIANAEMAAAWDGEEGDHWTEFADRYDAGTVPLWRHFLDAVRIKPTDRVLDIGCGTGRSTLDVAKLATAGSALGVDLSSRMLAEAQRRSQAEGITNAEFVQADAQVHPFDKGAFDLVISRFGAMFFNDRAAAFANFASALKQGGRLALLTWGRFEDNEWLIAFREALAVGRDLPVPPLGAPGPFGLADNGVPSMLADAGYTDVKLERVDERERFGSDFDEAWSWVSHMGMVKGMTETLSEADRTTALSNLQAVLRANESEDGVSLGASSLLITATKS